MLSSFRTLCSNNKKTYESGRRHRVRTGLAAVCQSVALIGLIAICLLFSAYNVDIFHKSSEGNGGTIVRNLKESSMCRAADDDPSCPTGLSHPAMVIPCLMGVLYIFWAIAIVCDDFFVPALEAIAVKLEMSDDIAGATLMAAGGSAPELATSLIGTFQGSDVGFGTIVGSAVFNVLFVIACCVAFTPDEFAPLRLTGWPLGRDCLYYILSLLVLFIFFGIVSPGEIELWEAIMLFVMYLGYCTIMFFNEDLQAKVTGGATKVTPEEEVDQEDDRASQRLNFYQPSKFRTGFFSLSGNGLSLFDSAGLGIVYKLKGNVKEAFEALDTDKSGSLEKEELKTLLKELFETPQNPVKDEQVDELMIGLDLDKNGVVDLHEFTEWYIKSEKRLQYEERQVFNDLDTDASGSIPIEQFPHLLTRLQVAAPPEKIEEVMKEFEMKSMEGNNQGKLSFDEFSLWFEASAYWEDKQKIAENVAEDNDGLWGELMDFPKATVTGTLTYLLMAPILWPLAISMGYIDARIPGNERHCYLQFFISIIWIGFYSYFMVDWITLVGVTLGIPAVVMGLTLLAAGTSVPDLLSSVVVAKAGKGDMAVSSSIGSNIFDVTVGLPIPWILFNLVMGCPVQVGADNLVISIVVLIGMVAAVITTIVLSDWKMNKILGWTMMALYVCFLGQDVARVFASNKVQC